MFLLFFIGMDNAPGSQIYSKDSLIPTLGGLGVKRNLYKHVFQKNREFRLTNYFDDFFKVKRTQKYNGKLGTDTEPIYGVYGLLEKRKKEELQAAITPTN
jgi:hypothetical protein